MPNITRKWFDESVYKNALNILNRVERTIFNRAQSMMAVLAGPASNPKLKYVRGPIVGENSQHYAWTKTYVGGFAFGKAGNRAGGEYEAIVRYAGKKLGIPVAAINAGVFNSGSWESIFRTAYVGLYNRLNAQLNTAEHSMRTDVNNQRVADLVVELNRTRVPVPAGLVAFGESVMTGPVPKGSDHKASEYITLFEGVDRILKMLPLFARMREKITAAMNEAAAGRASEAKKAAPVIVAPPAPGPEKVQPAQSVPATAPVTAHRVAPVPAPLPEDVVRTAPVSRPVTVNVSTSTGGKDEAPLTDTGKGDNNFIKYAALAVPLIIAMKGG